MADESVLGREEMHRLAAGRQLALARNSDRLRSFVESGARFQAWPVSGPGSERRSNDDANLTVGRERKRLRKLVVLDSSFNPPTRAHLRMARSGLEAVMADTKTETGAKTEDISETGRRRGEGDGDVGLLLLLAVNNADKGVKPAAFPARLAMMEAFAADLLADMGDAGSHKGRETQLDTSTGKAEAEAANASVSVSVGLTTLPYFHDKCAAVAETWSPAPAPGTSTRSDDAEIGPAMEQTYLAGFDTLIRIFNPKYYAATPDQRRSIREGGGEVTPMQAALDPFFARARLRVTLRTDDAWGSRAEQFAYVEELKAGGLERVGGRAAWMDRVELVDGRKEGESVVSSSAVREAIRTGRTGALDGLLSPLVREWVVSERLYVEEGQ